MIIEEMIGKIFTQVESDEEELTFVSDDKIFNFYHDQDCCEYVYIESINGDLNDLIGSPILVAEEKINDDIPPLSEHEDSYTWTFYTFATVKGWVDVRWYGTSNGYYSEGVNLRIHERK